jgi:hypothetical protein
MNGFALDLQLSQFPYIIHASSMVKARRFIIWVYIAVVTISWLLQFRQLFTLLEHDVDVRSLKDGSLNMGLLDSRTLNSK